MKILMVSPHPTYSPRGTPISVLNRCRALSALGHEIDLVTYGIGEDVPVPGLTYMRAPVPGVTSVKVGPSAAKVPLDLAVFARTAVELVRSRGHYQVLHTHEEAGTLGAAVRRLTKLPHIYDMGNDLSVVMRNYGYSERHAATRVASRVESAVVSKSDLVLAHFPSIATRVEAITGDPTRAVVVPNIALEPAPDTEVTAGLRQAWSHDGMPVALYTGTLEAYQGIPAMVDAVGILTAKGIDVRVVIVGGRPDQRARIARQAASLGLTDRVLLVAPMASDLIPSALQAADVLLSPRAYGSNTPLKLFSYMASGRPILATAIESHTQVLDEGSAVLVPPDPEGLATGLKSLLEDSGVAAATAAGARALASAHYSPAEYVRRVAQGYSRVGGPAPTDVEIDAATKLLHAQFHSKRGAP